MVAVVQRLVFLVAAFQRFHAVGRNFSGLKVVQAKVDNFCTQQHLHAALHGFVLLICVSNARPRPPGKRRYDGQKRRKQVLKEVPHSLYLRNVCLDIRKALVCFIGAGVRRFKLSFQFLCAAARTSLRHAGGAPLHWPVDRYFEQGPRDAVFLGEHMRKYHRTVTGYVQPLLARGFALEALVEPQPAREMLDAVPGMADELRRPMMLILKARKPRRSGREQE